MTLITRINTNMIRREFSPEVKVIGDGIVEYVASDQSIDAQSEIVRADGWRFDRFAKNSPLVDSHKYGKGIDSIIGKVIDYRVENNRLVETAKWAIDVPENDLARLGWAMTKAGYLKAVSVGFVPEMLVTQVPNDAWPDDWAGAKIVPANSKPGKPIWEGLMRDLGIGSGRRVSTVYVQQQQIELSVCVLGSNPNALAKSYKAGVLNDADLEIISRELNKRLNTACEASESAAALQARQRGRGKFLDELKTLIKKM